MAIISFPSSFVNTSKSPRPSVQWAIRHGFHGIEFNGNHAPLTDFSEDDRKYLRAKAVQHGLTYTYHFKSDAMPGSHDEARRASDLKHLKDNLIAGSEIGTKIFVIHPGKIDVQRNGQRSGHDPTRLEAIQHLVEFMKAAAPTAENLGISLCLENMHHNPGYVLQSFAELATVVTDVGSPMVAATFDIGHAWGAGSIENGLEVLGSHIRHLHFHDCLGTAGSGIVDNQHLEIGTGLIDFSKYLDFVRSYPFVISLETESIQDPLGCILRSRDRLRQTLSGVVD